MMQSFFFSLTIRVFQTHIEYFLFRLKHPKDIVKHTSDINYNLYKRTWKTQAFQVNIEVLLRYFAFDSNIVFASYPFRKMDVYIGFWRQQY